MKAENFNLHAYLARIGFQGKAQADIHTVRSMMRCQLFTVPFENLDVQAGKVVSLLPEDIVDKIVTHKRGGYCYEVNGLFAMALVVTLNSEQWLCDLGFGSYGIRASIALACLNQERLIVLHTPTGRKILLGNVLKTIEQGVSHTVDLAPEQTASILLCEFGLIDQ